MSRDPSLLQDERHDLVGQTCTAWVGGFTSSTHPDCARRKMATDCSIASVLRQKKVQFARVASRRPVRPILCRNDATDAGASTCSTRSRSPTSIPSSMVYVHTMAVFCPWEKRSSASMRSARLTELWWMNTSTLDPARAWATFSARDRLSTNTRLLRPRATLEMDAATSSMSSHVTTDRSRGVGGLGGSTSRKGRVLAPASQRPIMCGFPTVAERPMRWKSCPLMATEALQEAGQVGSSVHPREGVHLVDDHGSHAPEQGVRIRARAHEHDLERLRRRHQHMGGLLAKALLA